MKIKNRGIWQIVKIMTEKSKEIRSNIERTVAHIARMSGVNQDAVWAEMYLYASEHVSVK